MFSKVFPKILPAFR